MSRRRCRFCGCRSGEEEKSIEYRQEDRQTKCWRSVFFARIAFRAVESFIVLKSYKCNRCL